LKAASKPKSPSDSKAAAEQAKPTSPPKKKRKVDTEAKPATGSPYISAATQLSPKPKGDASSTSKKQTSNRGSTTKPPPNPTPPNKIAHQIHTPPNKDEESVTKIVRSTANRAKNARQRALSISKSAKVALKGKKPRHRKAIDVV
jgi:hypothetical protein